MVHGNEFVTEAITVKVPKTLNLSEANTEFKYEPEDWTNGQVKVSIETNVDTESLGVALEYSLNGGNTWTEYTEPIQVSDNGTIRARLRDKEDNETGETYATGNVTNIDRLKPNEFSITETSSTDSSITIGGSTTDANATATDGSSEIKAYYYSIDDGATWFPQNGTLETSYTFNNLPDTTTYTTLKMKAVDNAENERVTEAITVATKKVNKPYVGDYVSYVPQSEETSYKVEGKYSGYTSDQTIKQEPLNWRILNINEDGTIDLISKTPTTATVYLEGALGYNNGVYLLNDLCKTLYSNSKYGATARSIKIEDIQDKMDLDVWDYHDFTYYIKYGDAKDIYGYSYPYQWSQEKSEKNAIEGVLTTGTLGQSEQYELTEETYITKNYTATQTAWQRNLYKESFKAVITRNSQNDVGMYYQLIPAQDYWLSSRVSHYNNGPFHHGLAKMDGGGILYDILQLYSDDYGPYSHQARVIVNLPITQIDRSTDYETEGTWNLK